MTFFVTGMPRSRTAWFAAFLSDGQRICHHELDIGRVRQLKRDEGDSDPRLPYTAFRQWHPHAPLLVIHRDPDEVAHSLDRSGLRPGAAADDFIEYAYRLRQLPALHVNFHDINGRLEEICDHLGSRFDARRAQLFKQFRVDRGIHEVISL